MYSMQIISLTKVVDLPSRRRGKIEVNCLANDSVNSFKRLILHNLVGPRLLVPEVYMA